MIIHASNDFVKRYKCRMSLVDAEVQKSRRTDSWSVHVYRIGTTPFVIFMHDASLWSLIIRAKGVTKLEKLLPLFLSRVQEVWQMHGSALDPQNQSILFLPRRDRSLIGSMNDAVRHIKMLADIAHFEGRLVDWKELETYLQSTPFRAIEYDSPDRRLKTILGG